MARDRGKVKKQALTEPVTFYHNTRRSLFMGVFMACLAVFSVYYVLNPDVFGVRPSDGLTYLGVVLIFIFAAMLLHHGSRTRPAIVIAPEGVEIYGHGDDVLCEWSDVLAFMEVRSRFNKQISMGFRHFDPNAFPGAKEKPRVISFDEKSLRDGIEPVLQVFRRVRPDLELSGDARMPGT